MKICLVNPAILTDNQYQSPLSSKNRFFINPTNIPHIGLGYLASYLQKNGYEADIIECGYEDLKIRDVVDRIKKVRYDVVGISGYYYNYKHVVKLLSRMKREAIPAFTIVGGYFPTLSHELLLKNLEHIDCCVIGEGEATLLEILTKIKNKKNWKTVKGIAYKEGEEIIFTGKRQLIANLDEIPFPARPFISDRKIAVMITTRGCYGNCIYCSVNKFFHKSTGKPVRRRSPQNVAEEIKYLVQEHGIKYIRFNDDNFPLSSYGGGEWFREFYRLIKENNIQVKFTGSFRVNEIIAAENLLKKFKEIGLIWVVIGIESFIQSQLDFFRKKVTVEDNIRAIRIIEENKLKYTLGMLVFDPVITVREILDYLGAIKKYNLFENDYNILRPLSTGSTVVATTGTKLYEYVGANHLYARNKNNYKFKHSDTALCYEIMTRWGKRMDFIFNNNYLSFVAGENHQEDAQKEIIRLHKDLFKIDLDFFMEICAHILENPGKPVEEFSGIIREKDRQLTRIQEGFAEIEKSLKHYIEEKAAPQKTVREKDQIINY